MSSRRPRPTGLAALALALGGLIACSADGPWYDTAPDPDLSYLPLGDVLYREAALSWTRGGRTIAVDGYLPDVAAAPVVVMLPGALVVKERYRWMGATLASHGIATFVVQPHGAFGASEHTLGTLDALAADPGLADVRAHLDLSRVVLAGHSAGGVAQVGLVDVAACPPGICAPTDTTPAALRGLILLGYHNQARDTDRAPMAAAEVPWLLMSGSRDGLATPDKVAITVDRIEDRPLHAIQIEGGNHYQLTDYVDVRADLRLDDDSDPTIGNRAARATAARYLVAFAARYLAGDAAIADDLGAADDPAVTADTRLARLTLLDPGLPRVIRQRLGGSALTETPTTADVVASAAWRGDRYLLVRDAVTGARVLRLDPAGTFTPVVSPDAAGGPAAFHGNPRLDGLLGAMVVFRDELYVGVSSGAQGGELASTGAEVWAWNGARWRPVVSRQVDEDPPATVSGVTGCAANDGDPSAIVRVADAGWTPGALRGAVLDDVGSPTAEPGADPIVWEVLDNSADSLTVQANDLAHTVESTVCDRLGPGDVVYLRQGDDESGFGHPWSKGLAAMAVYDDRLYVGTALDYEDGAELRVSTDGVRFDVAVARASFGRHPDGVPITTSISALYPSSVSGRPLLYLGGTGTEDHGARLFTLDAAGTLIARIDDAVDADEVGLDEAGMGSGNHQVSSMIDFGDRLWLATLHFEGSELFSSRDGVTWNREVGAGARLGPGWGDPSQLAGRLAVAGGYLWVHDVAFVQLASELRQKSGYVFRTRDGAGWQMVTGHAFGTNAVQVSQLFEWPGGAPGAAPRLAAVTSGAALAQPTIFRPLQLYVLADHPSPDEEKRR